MYSSIHVPIYYQQPYCFPTYYQFYYLPIVSQGIAQQVPAENVEQSLPEVANMDQPSPPSIGEQSNSPDIQQSDQQNTLEQRSLPTLKANLLTDSTNVNKNFAKAIAQYILRQKSVVAKLLGEKKAKELIALMSTLRNRIGNLSHIIRYTNDEEILQMVRIMGINFLKKESAAYVYSSKIQHKTNHIKNRHLIKKNLMKY